MHKLRQIDLNLLVIFQVIFEEKSLSRAGRRVGLSQSALSHSLSRLRSCFSDPLFIRSSSGMTPTNFARQIYSDILKALSLIQRSLCPEEERFAPGTSTRRFSLTMGEYGEYLILPGLLNRLEEEAPGISLHLNPGYGLDAALDLRKGEIDLAMDWLPFDEKGEFCTRTLIHEKIVAIARKGHPAVSERLTLKLFTEIPHVIYRPRFAHGNPMDNALKTLGMVRKIATVVNQLCMIPGIIAKSDYLGIMPSHFARQMKNHYSFQILDLPFEPFRGSVYMIWHRSEDPDPGHRWLRNQIAGLAEEISNPAALFKDKSKNEQRAFPCQ